jgi:hypothetical protein
MAVKKAGGTLKGRFVCWLNTTYDGHLTKGLAGFAGAMFSIALHSNSLKVLKLSWDQHIPGRFVRNVQMFVFFP